MRHNHKIDVFTNGDDNGFSIYKRNQRGNPYTDDKWLVRIVVAAMVIFMFAGIVFPGQPVGQHKGADVFSTVTKRAENVQVFLYTSPGCPYCVKMKKFLSSNGIHYTEKNVVTDAQARREFMKLGQDSVPVLVIKANGKTVGTIVGMGDANQMLKLLKKEGAV